MMKRLAVVALLALATPAQAQEATIDPDHIVSVLKDAGYPAEYLNSGADFRQILTKVGQRQFLVELYDCTDRKACETMEFTAEFPMEEPPTNDAISAYSGPHEGARVALDRRGKPTMAMEIDIPDEGLSDTQFIAHMKSWETMIAAFLDFLTHPPREAPAAPAVATAAPTS